MMKRYWFLLAALALTFACAFLFSACGGEPGKESGTQVVSESGTETETDRLVPSSGTESESEPGGASRETTPGTEDDAVAKITGGADEVGIYAVVVRLTGRAADKGVIELVYYGAKGSPQENSVVNTFRIEYEKETSETYEIRTFSDGEVYQHLRNRDEMKVTNEFGASLRAGSVIVSYTPDGGESQEIFRAEAEYFR